MANENPNEFRLSRRGMVLAGAGALAACVPISQVFAQQAPPPGPGVRAGGGEPPPISAETVDAILRRRLSGPNACTVASQTVEGPYYIDNRLMRSDIREKQVGETMKLRLQVMDANAICEPLAGALVSVWHANAMGFYSGYHNTVPDRLQPQGERIRGHAPEQDDERWLRGVQTTDKDGWVTFTTIFPGWYTMRAPHLHARVFRNEREMATTQFLFSQALVNNILVKQPYAKRGPGIITNENDLVRIQSNLGPSAILDTERDASGMLVATAHIGLSHA